MQLWQYCLLVIFVLYSPQMMQKGNLVYKISWFMQPKAFEKSQDSSNTHFFNRFQYTFFYCLDYLHCFGLDPVTTAF
jgi:hypothetical protein